MSEDFAIHALPAAGGAVAVCPLPGRYSPYESDFAKILDWSPNLVLSMTTMAEMDRQFVSGLGDDLAAQGIAWRHLPIADFGVAQAEVLTIWPDVSAQARSVLSQGGRVLAHCYGGCGRSGMAILRLMVEAGETPSNALAKLRNIRPCAVETKAQLAWATAPQVG